MTNEQIFHAKIKELANNPDAYNAYSQLPELFDTVSPGDKLNLFESLDRFDIEDLPNVKDAIEEHVSENIHDITLDYLDPSDPDLFLAYSYPEYVGRFYAYRDIEELSQVLSAMLLHDSIERIGEHLTDMDMTILSEIVERYEQGENR